MHLCSFRNSSILLLILVLSGCASRVAQPAGGPGAPLATAAVERFLHLAGERDYVQMGWLFGNAQGAILRQHPVGEVEKRMYALAHVLQHDSYVLGNESAVPGRMGGAVRYDVALTRGTRTLQVPITVTRGPDSRWFVELIDVEAVTNVR
ncbi:hypothetical protein BH23GEM6_BH23GEM6_15200 [soil metagenome]